MIVYASPFDVIRSLQAWNKLVDASEEEVDRVSEIAIHPVNGFKVRSLRCIVRMVMTISR